MAETYQILVRLLDGRTHCLRFPTPTISGAALFAAVSSLSRIPAASLRLVSGRSSISPSFVLTSSSGHFPTASALLRLRGGKGGFGSLLRGAASKAGQKKTSNFDACRDMSGRRLRHINAERRLEEWKAEAADRKLEKLAEDFIRKKAKEAGRGGGAGAAEVEKYLEKFRKDAELCVGQVEESVRASLGKRKATPKPPSGVDSKKLKIWLGKKKVEDSESDSDSDSDKDNDVDGDGVDGADGKSIVLNEGNCSNGSDNGEEKLSQGYVSRSHSEGESSVEKSQCSDLDENGNCVQVSPEMAASLGSEHGIFESDVGVDPEGVMVDKSLDENAIVAGSEEVSRLDGVKCQVDNNGPAKLDSNEPEMSPLEEAAERTEASPSEEPLDLAKYSSAAEFEVLGLERLKVELQNRGLKCGGTLRDRSARLFLLKTTPLEKLPKKLLAGPVAGRK